MKNELKNYENVTGVTCWDEKNHKGVVRCLKENQIYVEDLINELSFKSSEKYVVESITGGFNNPEVNFVIKW